MDVCLGTLLLNVTSYFVKQMFTCMQRVPRKSKTWPSVSKHPALRRTNSLSKDTEELANFTLFKNKRTGINSLSNGYVDNNPHSVFCFMLREYLTTFGAVAFEVA